MTQHIEIEFKNFLTKQQYEQLVTYFNAQQLICNQANHYFDTNDFQLKSLRCALRIRQVHDTYECTLKEKTSEYESLETTDLLTVEQAHAILKGGLLNAPSVKERLASLQIDVSQLRLFGSLHTNRAEIVYKGGTLVLDHSYYFQQEDYEVEYETTSLEEGRDIFEQFLLDHHIPKQHTDKKIARFMQALQQQE